MRTGWWARRGGAAGVGLRGAAAPSAAGASLSWRGLRQDTIDTLGTAGPVLLSLTFMLYSLMFFALFSFLPVLLMERLGLSLAQAGLYSAIATVANVIGNLGAGMLLARRLAAFDADRDRLRIDGPDRLADLPLGARRP